MINILIGFSIAVGIALRLTGIGWINAVEHRLACLESEPTLATRGPRCSPSPNAGGLVDSITTDSPPTDINKK